MHPHSNESCSQSGDPLSNRLVVALKLATVALKLATVLTSLFGLWLMYIRPDMAPFVAVVIDTLRRFAFP